MQKYRGNQLVRAGIIGVVLAILVVAVGLQPERLVQWATSLRYQALFSEAGGIAIGNDVTVSGIKVGSVSSVKLDNGDALVGFTINGKYALGSDTKAQIRTGTLLGERVLVLESAGSGNLDPRQPVERRTQLRCDLIQRRRQGIQRLVQRFGVRACGVGGEVADGIGQRIRGRGS